MHTKRRFIDVKNHEIIGLFRLFKIQNLRQSRTQSCHRQEVGTASVFNK